MLICFYNDTVLPTPLTAAKRMRIHIYIWTHIYTIMYVKLNFVIIFIHIYRYILRWEKKHLKFTKFNVFAVKKFHLFYYYVKMFFDQNKNYWLNSENEYKINNFLLKRNDWVKYFYCKRAIFSLSVGGPSAE